ncbi:hypothetical protein JOQ06_020136, partial [Pogonophryne albipinna]
MPVDIGWCKAVSWDGCDSSLAGPAAVSACPGSKHNIVSPLTTIDGHQMMESPSKTSSDWKQNTWAL